MLDTCSAVIAAVEFLLCFIFRATCFLFELLIYRLLLIAPGNVCTGRTVAVMKVFAKRASPVSTRGMHTIFATLAIPNYGIFAASNAFSLIGTLDAAHGCWLACGS